MEIVFLYAFNPTLPIVPNARTINGATTPAATPKDSARVVEIKPTTKNLETVICSLNSFEPNRHPVTMA